MEKIIYKSINYEQFVQALALKMKSKVKDGFLKISPDFGEGYIWAENFENGISFFASELCFNTDILLQRTAGEDSYLILHFHEAVDNPDEKNRINWPEGLRKSAAFLTNTYLGSEYLFPKGCRLRSCSILFEKKHLIRIMESDVADEFISLYFSEFFRGKKIEPLDTIYRMLMNELIHEKIEHPFPDLFIQNRIMLLIERFVINFLHKSKHLNKHLKLSEEEINRLMKVESLLIKNFNDTPPLIDALSRICAMSPTKLKKDFKSLYGMPVYEYYQKNRMMHAKKLLLENKYTTAEVGRLVGYTNLGHFAASFKKEFNVLPKNIAKQKTEISNRAQEIFAKA